MGEVELADAGNTPALVNAESSGMYQTGEQQGFNEFMTTNRTGRRNALACPYLGFAMELQQNDGCCGNRDDSTVRGLAERFQNMGTTSAFLHEASTSGYSTNNCQNNNGQLNSGSNTPATG